MMHLGPFVMPVCAIWVHLTVVQAVDASMVGPSPRKGVIQILMILACLPPTQPPPIAGAEQRAQKSVWRLLGPLGASPKLATIDQI